MYLYKVETDSLETQQELFTSVDFKIGSLSHATVNIEKVHKINMNVAILSNFGLVTYIHLFLLVVICTSSWPGMHFHIQDLVGINNMDCEIVTLK